MRAHPDSTRLVTERLVLRRTVPDDAEVISVYRSDPDVRRWQGWNATDPGTLRLEFAEMSTRTPGDSGWVQFSVERRATGELVGDVGLSPAEGEPGVIKVGYTMAPAHQGHGYGTEAVRALVDYAFDALGAQVVRAYASAENEPSIRVAKKVGLRLVEEFEHEDEGRMWRGVRYELRREDRQARGEARGETRG